MCGRISGWTAVVIAAWASQALAQPCETRWAPWLDVGPYGGIHAFMVFDDGGGPALYAAGDFTEIGGVAANRVAKWDGVTWSPLGSGIANGGVGALAWFDDGTGPALYVGGLFDRAGDVDAENIAKWDGSSWSPVWGPELHVVLIHALAVYDDGNGDALYVGGFYAEYDNVEIGNLVKWDGQSWSDVGGGVSHWTNGGTVTALAVFDDGSGPELYVGGCFASAGRDPGIAVNNIAKWNGGSWASVGQGIRGGGPDCDGSGYYPIVGSLAVFDDGSGAKLYAGGEFNVADEAIAHSIAAWDGVSWSPLLHRNDPANNGLGAGSIVRDLLPFDFGTGPVLCIAGDFYYYGYGTPGLQDLAVIQWTSESEFLAIAKGEGYAHALAGFDSGAGPELLAAGSIGRPYCGGPYNVYTPVCQVVERPGIVAVRSIKHHDNVGEVAIDVDLEASLEHDPAQVTTETRGYSGIDVIEIDFADRLDPCVAFLGADIVRITPDTGGSVDITLTNDDKTLVIEPYLPDQGTYLLELGEWVTAAGEVTPGDRDFEIRMLRGNVYADPGTGRQVVNALDIGLTGVRAHFGQDVHDPAEAIYDVDRDGVTDADDFSYLRLYLMGNTAP